MFYIVTDCEHNRREVPKDIGRVYTEPPTGVIYRYSDQVDAWIPAWVRIGMKNPWISRRAFDPWDGALSWLDSPFNASCFKRCENLEDLSEQLGGKWSWCIGVAFHYNNMAFINQVNGGNEWLVIRDDVSFDSLSGFACTPGYLEAYIEDVQAATPDQLKNLTYAYRIKNHQHGILSDSGRLIYRREEVS